MKEHTKKIRVSVQGVEISNLPVDRSDLREIRVGLPVRNRLRDWKTKLDADNADEVLNTAFDALAQQRGVNL